MLLDGLEHFPALLAPIDVTRDAVQDEDRFDSFGSKLKMVSSCHALAPTMARKPYLKMYLGPPIFVIPIGNLSSLILASTNSL